LLYGEANAYVVMEEVRAEFFNAFNTPRFGMPNTTFGSDTFGVVNSQYNSPRHGQIGFRRVLS
jgi:hypothetical protein